VGGREREREKGKEGEGRERRETEERGRERVREGKRGERDSKILKEKTILINLMFS